MKNSQVCKKCGTVVSDITRHQDRNRCAVHHIRKRKRLQVKNEQE